MKARSVGKSSVVFRNNGRDVSLPAYSLPTKMSWRAGAFLNLHESLFQERSPHLPMKELLRLVHIDRFPGLRALAWERDWLYASRGYELVRAQFDHLSRGLNWEHVADFRPSWWRRFSVQNRLSARLFRDGLHALCALPSGSLVAAAPGAIVTVRPNERTFRQSHTITRGTRPLHITSVPNGTVYWGEYFDNAERDEVHIFASQDQGETWHVAATFLKGEIRHVHNIVYDSWRDCVWIFTGDYGDECRILRATRDLRHIDVVLRGKQQARAVAAVPTEAGIYFASDTPLESNFVYRLDANGNVTRLGALSSSAIYGCRVGSRVFFSTMVEPSKVNKDPSVRLYGGNITKDTDWHSPLNWQKDVWPMRFFQYGNAFLPNGNNTTQFLALTTIAVKNDDVTTLLYECA